MSDSKLALRSGHLCGHLLRARYTGIVSVT